jgi:hypothetical protein
MSKVITSHVTIDAPVDAVWRTLTDLAAYSQWNPFITSAAGTVRRGERLNLTIQPPGGKPCGSSRRSRWSKSAVTWSGWVGCWSLASSTGGTPSS